MAKKELKEKKNIIVLLSIFILFTLTLCSCNWFGEGILNVFDPQAQIRVNFTEVKFAKGEGTIDLEIYSINQVEFIGEGFKYRYYKDGVLIPELSKDVGLAFYVAPSDSPGKPGEITKITDLPLYYQQVVDYVTMNPKITEIACTVSLIGTDGAGHDLAKSITVDFPAVQPGVDFEPPNAIIEVKPGTTGKSPFTVQFDASKSTDNRGIASYSWDFGDGTTGTGIMPAPHTYTCGAYVVKLSVTDHWGNVGYDTVTINVGETGGPSVTIEVKPGTTGSAPFTVYFDASKTKTETQCGAGTANYYWDFGDGSTGTGVVISHTYTSNGVYTVILTVTDSQGNKGYGSVVITVGVEEEEEDKGVDSIIVTANPATFDYDDGGNSNITAYVLNSNNEPIEDVTVIFSTEGGSLNSTDEKTDSDGKATVILTAPKNSTDESIIFKVTASAGGKNSFTNITVLKNTP